MNRIQVQVYRVLKSDTMNKFLFIPLLIIGSALQATPEKIYPKTKILKPIDWYAGQMAEWGAFVQSHSTDADAWLNYYAAGRFAQQANQRLDLIVNEMEAAIPNTFEYYLIHGWHAGFNPEATHYLNKAYELNPDHSGSY